MWRLYITADDITTCEISTHGFNEEDYVRMFVARLEVGRRGKRAETYVPRDKRFFIPYITPKARAFILFFSTSL